MTRMRERGMTLVEMMIGVVIALLIVGVMGSLYVSNKQVTRVNDAVSRLQENGRFALYRLKEDLRMAGFRGPCGNAIVPSIVLNATSYPYQFGVDIVGYHGTGAAWSPALVSDLSSISPAPLPDSDVVTIRRVEGPPVALTAAMASTSDHLQVSAGSTLAAGDLLLVADCAGATVFQATGYSAGVIEHVKGNGVPGNSTESVGRAFATDAVVYRLITRSYFIAPSARKVGVRSLWANTIPSYGGTAQPEELAEGVERLLTLYGEDLDADRAANRYVTAENVGDWANVVSARIQTLLASSDHITTSRQPYTFDNSTTTPTDARLRSPLASVVTLRNRIP